MAQEQPTDRFEFDGFGQRFQGMSILNADITKKS
jgi:hypothetical protein